jgi:K+-sensing histidine kinase KdpD
VIDVLEVVGHRHGRSFDDEDERLLTGFVDQARASAGAGPPLRRGGAEPVLARSDELKSSLLAAVSHDLRTPLGDDQGLGGLPPRP